MTLTMVGRLLLSFVYDVVYAPVWWYTEGLVWCIAGLGRSARNAWNSAGVGLWMKNIFVPMYGQTDFWGRLISFLIRVANIFGRFVWVLVWVLVLIVAWCVWMLVPIGAWFLIIASFFH